MRVLATHCPIPSITYEVYYLSPYRIRFGSPQSDCIVCSTPGGAASVVALTATGHVFLVFRSAMRGLVVKFCIVIGGNTDAEVIGGNTAAGEQMDICSWSVLSGRVQSHGELTRFWASYHSKLGGLFQVLPHAAGTV